MNHHANETHIACNYVVYRELRSYGWLAMMISLKKITSDFFSNIGSQYQFVVELWYGCKIPFRFKLTPKISDLMKIGGACHCVISEFPFKPSWHATMARMPRRETEM